MYKRIISYIFLTAAISLALVMLGIFYFKDSYLRTMEAFVDLWNSLKFYFSTLIFEETDVVPTITEYTRIFDDVVVENINPLPPTQDDFVGSSVTYFDLLFSKENFVGWGYALVEGLGYWGKIIAIIFPIFFAMMFFIKQLYGCTNNRYGKDTIPLSIYKSFNDKVVIRTKNYIVDYMHFLLNYRYVLIIWVVILLFHFNIIPIVVSFFAYYLYFSVSFTFDTIYIQLCKLLIDIKIGFRGYLMLLFIPLALYLFTKFRKDIALSRLRHYEAKNCGFINELPIVSMSVGSMGKKKTTLITDMALSQEVMFRQKAFEIIQNNDMKFPNFPWMKFELDIRCCMEYGTIYNLASIKDWINKKKSRYMLNGDAKKRLYNYDVKTYGMTYDNGIVEFDLFDVLETYAKAYFIYIIESSLLVTNYSIREDNVICSEGNFPIWNTDFFARRYSNESHHSHILDFDILRLGKKVIENNKKSGSFEFGIVVITEIGKERGNNLELKEVKKGNNDTNQKNDLFNSWLKMCRHSATVDNFPFIKVFTDEQRPESWGADARDLCDIVHIISTDKTKLAYPFYTLEEMLSDWAFSKFINMYYDFRYMRGDNLLLVHILKGIVGLIYRRNIRLYNKYGYSIVRVEKERGTMDSKAHKQKYYLANKKIYSKRFSTDCFSDYFNDMARNSLLGLNDYIEYETEKATVEELQAQNSYFVNALYKNNAP